MIAFLVLLVFFSSRAEAAENLAAQFSVMSSRMANGLLVSRFSVSQSMTELKKGYEIFVTHDTSSCNNSQDTTFSVELRAPRSPLGRYSLFTNDESWTEASDSCRQSGLTLAEPPETDEDLRAIKCAISKGIVGNPQEKKYVALGFRYDAVKKNFVTTTGKALNTAVALWAPHNPQTHHKEGSENCGAMDFQGRLHDVRCDTKMFHICQNS